MKNSSEISPTRRNNCVFILRSGFTLHVSGDNLTHHQETCRVKPSRRIKTQLFHLVGLISLLENFMSLQRVGFWPSTLQPVVVIAVVAAAVVTVVMTSL